MARERTIVRRLVPERPYSLALTAERYTAFRRWWTGSTGRRYRRLLPVGRRGVLLSVAQIGAAGRAVLEATLAGPDADSPRAAAASARRVVELALGASAAGARLLPRLRRRRRDRRRDPGLSRAPRGRPAVALGGSRHGDPRPAGQPPLRLRHPARARRDLRAARARFDGETLFRVSRRRGPSERRRAPGCAGSGSPTRRRGRSSEWPRPSRAASLDEEGMARLDDEAAIERLTALRGVGRWTAEIGLLRGLGRPDIFPAGDLGVVKYLAQGLLGRRDEGEGGRDAALRRAVAAVAQPRARLRLRRAQSTESGTSGRIGSSSTSVRSGKRLVTRS